MNKQHKRRLYMTPSVIEGVEIRLERDLLIGSIVDWALPVETAGLENGGFFNYESDSFSDSTFNHQWE